MIATVFDKYSRKEREKTCFAISAEMRWGTMKNIVANVVRKIRSTMAGENKMEDLLLQ